MSPAAKDSEIICDPPYILHGDSCCLDLNRNGICDTYEKDEDDILPTTTTHIDKARKEVEMIDEHVSAPTITTSTLEPEGEEIEFETVIEPGVRLMDASVPYVKRTKEGGYRLYYCGMEGILSAISDDGIVFEKEGGIRISPASLGTMVCDATIVDLPDGGMRMYYKSAKGRGGPGQSIHKIHSAISRDGLYFEIEGVVIDSEKTDDRGWASVPEAIILPDGSVRIYYVSDSEYSGHGIVSALSSDGIIFKAERTRMPGFVDPAITRLDGGKFLLLASVLPNNRELKQGIYIFTSGNGTDFKMLGGAYIKPGVIDPSIIEMDDGSWRIYFWNHMDNPPRIKSAILKTVPKV